MMLHCNNLCRAPRAGKRRRRSFAMLYRATPHRRTAPLPAIDLSAGPEDIEEAARLLRGGALVAFPTETVYGLGGDATSERAVAAIFAAKGRPRFNPLISHLAASEQAAEFAELDERAREVAARFWPGPLTLVLPRQIGRAHV